MTTLRSPLTRVPGFRAVGVTCGLKQSGQPDLALLLTESLGSAAAVFTTNAFKAAPVLYDMTLLKRNKGKVRAVVANAGNANAVTGEQGLRDAEQMARLTEAACGLPTDSVFVMSTGVIGHKLAMDKIEKGIRQASKEILTEAGLMGRNAAQAILTTDLVTKEAFLKTSIKDHNISIGGVAKGSGMIHPNMGTLLGMIATDALVEPNVLDAALKRAVAYSFNRVSVDGDTSTNDTVVILASGQANAVPICESTPEFDAFSAALTSVCTSLAKAVARDGEGATKLLEIVVRGAETETEAETAAKAMATSPLLKAALFGNDPNWGRALAAVGRSGIKVDPGRISLWLDDFQLVKLGEPLAIDAMAVQNWMVGRKEVSLRADLGLGSAEATVWSCDLSYKYIEINAEYHT